MYQEYFGFTRRPFPTHGASSPLISTPATEEVLPALERCVGEGRGIAILSAAAGTGKTAVAQEVGRRLSDTLHVVYLSSSNYTSSLGLLQAILFELGASYAGLSEEEARLHIIEFSRNLPDRAGIALLVDEAEQLTEPLLDELRALANYMHDGRPLLRLLLCGQLGLDERLAAPGMDAFNQRVGCHVVLEPLDRTQSAAYIRATLASSGAELEDVFSNDALDLICAASDGNIRCLHHLCDQALLMAFVAEEKPIASQTVRAALTDLQGLPLAWNVPAQSVPDAVEAPVSEDVDPGDSDERHIDWAPADAPEAVDRATPADEAAADEAATTVIEFGGDVPSETPVPDTQTNEMEPEPSSIDHNAVHSAEREFHLEDRYAELDRLAELEGRQETSAMMPDLEAVISHESPPDVPVPETTGQRTLEAELLAEMTDMRAEVQHVSSWREATDMSDPSAETGPPPSDVSEDESEWDVIQPEPQAEDAPAVVEASQHEEAAHQDEIVDATPTSSPQNETRHAHPALESDTAVDGDHPPEHRQNLFAENDGTRKYAFLFTRLRNRRRDLAARTGR